MSISHKQYADALALIKDYEKQEQAEADHLKNSQQNAYYQRVRDKFLSDEYVGVLIHHYDNDGTYTGHHTAYRNKMNIFQIDEYQLSDERKHTIKGLVLQHFPY